MSRLGLWQGQWSMFAPDPVIGNDWYYAELRRDDDLDPKEWFSPNWREASTWEKFYRFREVNYFNRLSLDENRIAARDFADWLLRQEPDQAYRSVSLFREEMKFVPPEPGDFPSINETLWVSQSNFLIQRNRSQK